MHQFGSLGELEIILIALLNFPAGATAEIVHRKLLDSGVPSRPEHVEEVWFLFMAISLSDVEKAFTTLGTYRLVDLLGKGQVRINESGIKELRAVEGIRQMLRAGSKSD